MKRSKTQKNETNRKKSCHQPGADGDKMEEGETDSTQDALTIASSQTDVAGAACSSDSTSLTQTSTDVYNLTSNDSPALINPTGVDVGAGEGFKIEIDDDQMNLLSREIFVKTEDTNVKLEHSNSTLLAVNSNDDTTESVPKSNLEYSKDEKSVNEMELERTIEGLSQPEEGIGSVDAIVEDGFKTVESSNEANRSASYLINCVNGKVVKVQESGEDINNHKVTFNKFTTKEISSEKVNQDAQPDKKFDRLNGNKIETNQNEKNSQAKIRSCDTKSNLCTDNESMKRILANLGTSEPENYSVSKNDKCEEERLKSKVFESSKPPFASTLNDNLDKQIKPVDDSKMSGKAHSSEFKNENQRNSISHSNDERSNSSKTAVSETHSKCPSGNKSQPKNSTSDTSKLSTISNNRNMKKEDKTADNTETASKRLTRSCTKSLEEQAKISEFKTAEIEQGCQINKDDSHKKTFANILNTNSNVKPSWKNFTQPIKAVGKQIKTLFSSSSSNIEKNNGYEEITVVFHVLIHSYTFSSDHECFIFCGPPLSNWKGGILAMHNVGRFEIDSKKYFILEGQFKLSIGFFGEYIPYKYVIKYKNELKWEQFGEDNFGDRLNRVLLVDDFSEAKHIYDDIICTVKWCYMHGPAREDAVVIFLPKIFDLETKSIHDALFSSDCILKCFNNKLLIDENNRIQPYGRNFKSETAINNYMKFISASLSKESSDPIYLKVIIFLCILSLRQKYDLKNIVLSNVFFSVLRDVNISLTENVWSILDQFSISAEIKKEFSQAMEKLIFQHIKLIAEQRNYNFDYGIWIFALPYLKYFISSETEYTKMEQNLKMTWKSQLKDNKSGNLDDTIQAATKLGMHTYEATILFIANIESFESIVKDECKIKLFDINQLLEKLMSCHQEITETSLRLLLSMINKHIKELTKEPGAKLEMQRLINFFAKSVNQADFKCKFKPITLLFLYENISRLRDLNEEKSSTCDTILDELLIVAFQEMNSMSRRRFSDQVTFYSEIIKHYKHSICHTESIRKHFIERLLKSKSRDDCMEIFSTVGINVHSTISLEIVNKIFDDDTDQSGKSFILSFINKINIFRHDNQSRNVAQFMSRLILMNKVPNIVDEKTCFKVFEDLTESANFVSVLNPIPQLTDQLSDEAQFALVKMKEHMDLLLSLLFKGQITLKTINMLTDDNRATRLTQLMIHFLCRDYSKLIKLRKTELQLYQTDLDIIKKFLSYFKINSNPDFSIIDEQIKTFSRIDNRLEMVFNVSEDYEKSGTSDKVGSSNHPFSVKEFQIMTTFASNLKSKIFIQTLKQSLHDFKNEENKDLTLQNIGAICTNTFDYFETFLLQLCEGNIILKEIHEKFDKFYKDNTINEELEILKQLHIKDWRNEIVQQIMIFFEIVKYTKTAQIILDIQTVLKISNTYSAINNILNSASDEDLYLQQPLSSIDSDSIRCGEIFAKFSSALISALETFHGCTSLITWMNTNVESAQEFKVFIDLASISAGESDIDVDRILCFQSAIMAYSPFFFDLKSEPSLDKFLAACESLQMSLERDLNIEDKLKEANLNVRWIDSIKESHGSVEASSLKMVQLINKTGVFKVGLKSTSPPESYVKLSYTLETPEMDSKELKLEELKELESKLMLISIPQEERVVVDRFAESLHQIILVSKNLQYLLEDGCNLFSQWSLICYMNDNREVCVLVDFGHKTSTISGTSILREELKTVSDFLLRCQISWHDHMEQLRKEYTALNYFTTNQLVQLSSLLAQLKNQESQSINRETAMLLHHMIPRADIESIMLCIMKILNESSIDIDNSVNIDELKDISLSFIEKISSEYNLNVDYVKLAIEKTGETSDVDKIAEWCLSNPKYDKDDYDDNASDNSDKSYSTAESNSTKGEYVKELSKDQLIEEIVSKYNFNRELVKVGFKRLGEKADIDKIADWCLENIDSLKDMTAEDNNVEEMSIENSLSNQNRQLEYLSNNLNDYWNSYLSSVDDLDVEDFISFKLLSIILHKLNLEFVKDLNREFPAYLKEGVPNLVVCSNREILTSVLSLYQFDPKKPLPSLDEVFICTTQTPRQHIELHCLRAFYDTSGKIYTLIHADRIDFETSCFIEKLCLTIATNNAYRLVFFSNKENDEHSFISTAFDLFRATLPILSSEALKIYMHDHLTNVSMKMAGLPHLYSLMIIASHRPGDGKSLLVNRISEKSNGLCKTKVLHQESIDLGSIIKSWNSSLNETNVFHLDITESVADTCEDLLFYLAVCRGVLDTMGALWKCNSSHLYLIELTVPNFDAETEIRCEASFKRTLPTIWCNSPEKSCHIYAQNPHTGVFTENEHGYLHFMDNDIFMSDCVQRPCQYLANFDAKTCFDKFSYIEPDKDKLKCLKLLLKYCCIEDPSWGELLNFCNFLNFQLLSCEKSVFCNAVFVGDTLPNFKMLVVKFLIHMSKDFATRSVEISDKSVLFPKIIDRNRWENHPHPYIFFNEDGQSMSFFGFKIQNRNLIDEKFDTILETNFISEDLLNGIQNQGVILNKPKMSHQQSRKYYIDKLIMIFGVLQLPLQMESDFFELTSDNVLKMLAIHMRFRANIPVIIMGETGTGKTRLIRFICDFQRQEKTERKNMVIMKCHGGVNDTNVYNAVRKAILLARENMKDGILQTVLFFDEANTTNAIGAIKEVMVDGLVDGEPIPKDIGLKFVAAVNPYREHSAEMIEKLEKAGLGYHMKAEQTSDRIGSIPMRRLVYRVKPIPPSLFSLIWDFGILDESTEIKYITQMVQRYTTQQNWPVECEPLLVSLLSVCQEFMRNQKDECSFVSLRDVERTLIILEWFMKKCEYILERIKSKYLQELPELDLNLYYSIMWAVGVSYYVRLENRDLFLTEILKTFSKFLKCQTNKPNVIFTVIDLCQNLFIEELRLDNNISRNSALKENVWMMAICMELRIPLFLVGKPGSSKSLAKTVVTDVMQGENSYSPLFKKMKEIQMISFQCSPLATADGIRSTFAQCQKYQRKQNLDTFVSVVVLDEVGLAEDSPKMPLKTLHPLLEDGCIDDDDEPEPYKKVAFIGISNWALDPAKMNRGVFVSRGTPTKDDLMKTARGICSNDESSYKLEAYIVDLVRGYDNLYRSQPREFYGLRDFYSLIKMLYKKCKSKGDILPQDIIECVGRCFGGSVGSFIPVAEFFSKMELLHSENPDISESDVCRKIIQSSFKDKEDSRYILFLTKNNAALKIILNNSKLVDPQMVSIIYGSSFPQDQEYSHLCQNMNRIKVAMELGRTVILCNLTNLYESLYDALNQSYVYLGGSRYVDLGLGTHRVKCRVHPNFRLIVVAEDSEVYERFPIPLINRLEKHFLGMQTLLDSDQVRLVQKLIEWALNISHVKRAKFLPEDVFIGYHNDAPASIIYRLSIESPELMNSPADMLDEAKKVMIQCATPDSISRLENCNLAAEECDHISEIYHTEQHHDSLYEFILNSLTKSTSGLLLQVTTHCRLMTVSAKNQLADELNFPHEHVFLLSLQQINTEEQFKRKLNDFLFRCSNKNSENIMIIQSDLGIKNQHGNLLECARYCIQDKVKQYHERNFTIILLIHLPRVSGGNFTGFPGSPWLSIHIDEISKNSHYLDLVSIKNKTIPGVISTEENLFKDLFVECLPKAIALLPSRKINNTLKIMRSVILALESKTFHALKFISSIKEKIIYLLNNEDRSILSPDKWIMSLATASIDLKEGCTFQQTVWLRLVRVVIPHLRDLLIICDMGTGLQHLTFPKVNDTPNTMSELYVDLLSSIRLNFTWFNIPDIKDNSHLPEHFVANVPFSWAFVRYADEIASTLKGSSIETFSHKLENDLLLEHFQSFCDLSEENMLLFIQDLVSLKVPEMSSNEMFVHSVSQCIFALAGNNFKESLVESQMKDEQILNASLRNKILIFETYKLLLDHLYRIKLIRELVNLNGQIIQDSLIKKSRITAMFTLDINCIESMLKLAEPNQKELLTFEHQQKWMKMIDALIQLLRRYFNDIESMNDDNSLDLAKEICRFQPDLVRLEIMRLFFEVVLLSETQDELRKSACKSLNLLSLSLKKGHLKLKECFDKFVNVLFKISNDSSTLHFRNGIEHCFLCKESMQEPVELECKHVACFKCLTDIRLSRIEAGNKNEWNCPFKKCRQNFKHGYELKKTTDCLEIVQRHNDFRKLLNRYFIEILQRYVFCDNEEPELGIIESLLKFVVTKRIKKHEERPKEITKDISVFSGDYIDTSPVVRSFVLQLILKCNWYSNQQLLESFIKSQTPFITDNEQLQSLYSIIIVSMEDCILSNNLNESFTFEYFKNEQFDFYSDNLIDKLRFVAVTRIHLNIISNILHEHIRHRNVTDQHKEVLISAINFISKFPREYLQHYLVRAFVGKFSMNAIKEWKSLDVGSELLPECLQKAALIYVQDVFLVFGQDYLKIRQMLRHSVFEKTTVNLQPFLTSKSKTHQFYLSCAFYYFLIIEADETLTLKMPEFLQENELLVELGSRFMPDNIQTCPILSHALETNVKVQDKSIFSLIFHLNEAIQHTQKWDTIANVFWTMVGNPNSLLRMYLPAMPQDDNYIAMRSLFGSIVTQYFLCPNGHPFGVGDCGKLSQSGMCNICKETIGPNQRGGGRIMTLTDTTQPGYVVQQFQDVNEAATNMRDMSPLHVAVIRFLLHCCMYISAGGPGKDTISAMVHDADIHEFFMQNLRLNCNQITRALGQSEDATIVLLHSIVMAMRDINSTDQHSLANITDRRVWENAFVRSIINPCTARLNETFQRFQADLQNDSGSGEDLIYDVLRGTDSEKDTSTEADIPFVPAFWFYRRRLTLDNLESYLETDPNVEKHHRLSEVCPSLFYLMANRELLQHTPSLIDIIRLQNNLVHNFSGRLEYQEIENQTIKQFLLFKVDEHLREKIRNPISTYLSTLLKLQNWVYQFDHFGVAAKEYLENAKMSLYPTEAAADLTEWPATLLFPCNKGFGLFAKVLVSLLIRAHNAAVEKYVIIEDPRDDKTTPVLLNQIDTDSLVCFSADQLHLMLLTNTSHDLHLGRTSLTRDNIDLESFERQVVNRYFRDRRVIYTKHHGLPEFQFWSSTLPWVPHSRPLADLDKESVVPQTVLPQALRMQLETEIAADLPELCRLLSVLHTARDLVRITAVANSAAASKMPLLDELERLSLLRDTDPLRRSRFLRARPGVELRHLDGLVHALQLLRTRRMLARRQDPWFEVVPDSMREPMLPLSSTIAGDNSSSLIRSEEEAELIRPLLVAVSGPVLLGCLQLFISAASATDQLIVQADWDLAGTLVAFLETSDDQNTAKLIQKHLPICILVKHTTALFEAALRFIDK